MSEKPGMLNAKALKDNEGLLPQWDYLTKKQRDTIDAEIAKIDLPPKKQSAARNRLMSPWLDAANKRFNQQLKKLLRMLGV